MREPHRSSLLAVSNNGLKAGSSFGFDTTNAATGPVTFSHVLTDSAGPGSGPVGYAKLGTGTLVLDQANSCAPTLLGRPGQRVAKGMGEFEVKS